MASEGGSTLSGMLEGVIMNDGGTSQGTVHAIRVSLASGEARIPRATALSAGRKSGRTAYRPQIRIRVSGDSRL